MRRALFIVDDRPEAGRGHVVRCGALAAELRARGWETVIAASHGGVFDVVVHDVRDDWVTTEAAKSYLAVGAYRTVVVDDTGRRQFGPVDIIVNGGAGATAGQYANSYASKVLAGPQYALLRPEFRERQWNPLRPSWSEDFRGMVGQTAVQVSSEMAAVTVALSWSGMRAMELACIGTPSILFVESEDQRMNAEALQRKCAAIVAYTEEYARKQVKQLLGDPDWLARMSHSGRSLVDGKGCIRVADEIERLVS